MFLCSLVSLCDGAYKGEESYYSVIFTTQRDQVSAHINIREILMEDTGLCK